MLIGNREWLSSNQVDLTPIGQKLDSFEEEGKTAVLVAIDGELVHFYTYSTHPIVNLQLPLSCVVLIQCMSPIKLLSTYFNLSQPSVMLIQCVSPIELLSTYFNLSQPSVMLIQCVSPIELLSTYFNLSNPV